MKAKNCLGGLALGALVGIGVGYWIATDPKKRRKIGRFISNVEDKVNEVKENVMEKYNDFKDSVADSCGCNGLTEDELDELDTILVAEAIAEAEADMVAMQAEIEAENEAENNKKNKRS